MSQPGRAIAQTDGLLDDAILNGTTNVEMGSPHWLSMCRPSRSTKSSIDKEGRGQVPRGCLAGSLKTLQNIGVTGMGAEMILYLLNRSMKAANSQQYGLEHAYLASWERLANVRRSRATEHCEKVFLAREMDDHLELHTEVNEIDSDPP